MAQTTRPHEIAILTLFFFIVQY